MPGDGQAVWIEKMMAITHADFFRSLPNAMQGEDFFIDGGRVIVGDETQGYRIEIGPEGERRIALLAIPATPVTLSFFGYDEAARREVLARFDKAFQRAGG